MPAGSDGRYSGERLLFGLATGWSRRTSPVLETSHSSHHSIGTRIPLPSALRPHSIARRDPSLDEEGLPAYRFDVILRGDGETPFFLD